MSSIAIDVTVDVDLSDFDENELVDYVKSIGYHVIEEEYLESDTSFLTVQQMDLLLSFLPEFPIGSDLWFAKERLRTLYNGH